MINNFPFHNVEKRPWPIVVSFSLFSLLMGLVYWFHYKKFSRWIWFFLFLLLISSSIWWKDVTRERNQGFHKNFVVKNFYVGMILLIISEVFFFFRFFWAFFHKCWFPQSELGGEWPPSLTEKVLVDPFSIPLIKTIILLSSGITVTWAHFSLIISEERNFKIGLLLTVFLGVIFLFLQGFEYRKSIFSFKRFIYGSRFFLLTGFHGGHVIAGTIFLIVCFFRLLKISFISSHHVGLELAIWYWHFVDVVWLFLFVFLYWYGTN